MANRRCLSAMTRHCSFLSSSNTSLQTLRTLPHFDGFSQPDPLPLENPTSNLHFIRRDLEPFCCIQSESVRHFSSRRRNSGDQVDNDDEDGDDDEEVDEDEDDEEDEEGEISDEDVDDDNSSISNRIVDREYSIEEKENEANAIGYKVIGQLDPSERPFKWREPFFAVVQIGSHQFKVSNGDVIYAERLKFCEVNDKLILNRVLMLGSTNQTIIGRPILPDAAVHAVVEEHALDAKVIIFKKKRRKNYRRTKGHRQELTRLRITDIQGIEKPAKAAKPEKAARPEKAAKPEMEAVAA